MTLKKLILFPGENFGHVKIYIYLNSWSSRERDQWCVVTRGKLDQVGGQEDFLFEAKTDT